MCCWWCRRRSVLSLCNVPPGECGWPPAFSELLTLDEGVLPIVKVGRKIDSVRHYIMWPSRVHPMQKPRLDPIYSDRKQIGNQITIRSQSESKSESESEPEPETRTRARSGTGISRSRGRSGSQGVQWIMSDFGNGGRGSNVVPRTPLDNHWRRLESSE